MASVDTSIPFRALPRENMLDAFHRGRMQRQQQQMGGLQMKGARNELAVQGARTLAQGVLSSENPAEAYPRAREQARRLGMDVSRLPEQWGPDAEMLVKMVAKPEEAKYEFQARKQALMRANPGLSDQQATNLALNQYPSTIDPQTGERGVIDRVGAVMGGGGGMAAGGQALPQRGQQAPAQRGAALAPEGEPLPGLDEPPQQGAGQQQAQAGTSVGPEVEPDYPAAFGGESWGKGFANFVSDFAGLGLVFPDAAQGKRSLEKLALETKTTLNSVMGDDTRGGKYLMDEFGSVIPSVMSAQGPEDALQSLSLLRDTFVTARDIEKRILDSRVSGKRRSEAEVLIQKLDPLIEKYDQAINQFSEQYYGPQGGHPLRGGGQQRGGAAGQDSGMPPPPEGPPPEGVNENEWRWMTPEERALWQN